MEECRFVMSVTVSNKESTSLTLSYVCPHCGLVPKEDFMWWVIGRGTRPKIRGSAIGGVRLVERQYDWREANRALVRARLASGSLRQHDRCLYALFRTHRTRRISTRSFVMAPWNAAGESGWQPVLVSVM